ncbi:MAG: hypothetical protein QM756_23275 [Polyangiaceae bacterium]
MRTACALWLLLAAACGASHEAPRTAPATAKPPPSTPASAGPPQPPAAAAADVNADATVASALQVVSRVRGLAAKQPVPGVRMDCNALFEEVKRLLADEAPADVVAGETEVLFALDAVPANFDLRATLLRLYSSELAGFYDPKLRRMVLATDLGRDAEQMTLYHELVHALQDQHFDLNRVVEHVPEAEDSQAALHALAEGDATSAMTDVFAEASGMAVGQIPAGALKLDVALLQASPSLRDVPGVIARSLVAPYVDGLAFVRYQREHGGWASVDAAFQRPPASTEQLLHPEKYVAAEPVVALPPLESPSGSSLDPYRLVMGEQGLRMLFEEWLPAQAAAAAASGWGGDKLAVFTQGERRLVKWHLVFDNEVAARRALEAFARGAARSELGAEYEPLRPFADRQRALASIRAGDVCQARTQRGAFAAARHGRHVGVTLGPYQRAGNSVQGWSDCGASLKDARAIARAR